MIILNNCNCFIKKNKKLLFQCFRCQKCCSDLGFIDMIKISFHTKRVMLKRKCIFLNKNSCSIYNNRPKLCVTYKCGVLYEC
jgi:Fe-S-cluster containining protein